MKCGYWNKPEDPFCGLCYEPLHKQPPKPAPETAAAAPRSKPGLGQKAAGAAIGALAVALAVYLTTPPVPGGGRPDIRVNRYSAKSEAADKLLADYVNAKDALLKEIAAAAPPAAEAFSLTGDYTQKLFAIEDAYSKSMTALDLPAEGDLDAKRDSLYLEWLELHRQRESRAMEDFSAAYQHQLKRAGL